MGSSACRCEHPAMEATHQLDASLAEAARAAEAQDMRAWAARVEAMKRREEGPRAVEAPTGPTPAYGPAPAAMPIYSPPPSVTPSVSMGSVGHSLKVKIVSARGLRAADLAIMGGKSDPYCVCEIPGKSSSQFKTAVVKKSLQPEWNHEQELAGYEVGDSIMFTVYDHDYGKTDDLLGKFVLPSADFHPKGFDGELRLLEAGDGIQAYLKVQITPGLAMVGTGALTWNCPQCTYENALGASSCEMCGAPRPAQVAMRAPSRETPSIPSRETPSLTPAQANVLSNPQKQQLGVEVLSARGLRAADWGGTSDPFCVVEVPGKKLSKFQTPVVKKTLTPVWNHSGEIAEFVPGDKLSFSVFDYDRWKSPDFLGKLVLTSDQFYPHGFEGELPLSEAGKGIAAYLKVRITPDGAAAWRQSAQVGLTPLSQASPMLPTPGIRGGAVSQPLLPTAGSIASPLLASPFFPAVAGAPPPEVTVTIMGARGLRQGGSPYCLCEVPGKHQARIRTPVMEKTQTPMWNLKARVNEYAAGDSLIFTIQDQAKNGAVMGRLILTSAQFYPQGYEGELQLTDAGKGVEAFLRLAVEVAVNQSLPFTPQLATPPSAAPFATKGAARPLRVDIVAAKGLRSGQWFARSGIYCACEIPMKPYSRLLTKVVQDTTEPVWNHAAKIDEYIPGEPLDFTVWSRSETGGDELLGRVILPAAQFQQNGFEGELLLLESGSPYGAHLFVRVLSETRRWPYASLALPMSDCNLLGMAFSVLSGVPTGLPCDCTLLKGRARQPQPAFAQMRAVPPLPAYSLQVSEEQQADAPGMNVASVLDSLGAAYRDAGNFQEALVQGKKALDIRVDSLGDVHPDTAMSYYNIALTLRLQDRLDEAWKYHRKALMIRLQVHGEMHADTAASYTCLGAILLQKGELDSALEHYLRALEISQSILGERHSDTAACYNDVGAVFERRGELVQAEQYLAKALEVQRQVTGDYHPTVGDAHSNLGAVLWQGGRLDEALEQHQRAMEIRVQVLGEQHPDTALSYGNVGVILEQHARYGEALEHQQRALRIRLEALGQNHSETAASFINLGIVHERMSAFEQALEHYKMAQSILQQSVGGRHAWTEQAYKHIKRCELKGRIPPRDAIQR
mmetsp:Transcript_86728/g.240559  ORF Transcript_86728/g.240559 Transcript_86728/m.240559 type:complete len:1129 (+) Transcript_86728:53-3439(+)